ncbi:DUF5360 family protein [Paenibacillus turpanensis]|uniref:DUF5360 family protein n=1 Tax=Paenibacillus turpanensis TaxID=2689078 RepID=UPI0014089353|nr:DUF5360 family protein [Paenibacillus turpanensis]
MDRGLKTFMWITDAGFLLYWAVVFFDVIPKEYQYQDYRNELLVAWNVSFLPLDLFISITGFASMYFFYKRRPLAVPLCIISLTLTFCSGLQAIAFWSIRGDYDLTWWVPNLLLMVYPLVYLPKLMRKGYADL